MHFAGSGFWKWAPGWSKGDGGSQHLGRCGDPWDFALHKLSSPSSWDCLDEKWFSGDLTFSFLVIGNRRKTILLYQNSYFLRKRSLLFKLFFPCFRWQVLFFKIYLFLYLLSRMVVQIISHFQGRVWGAINQGDIHGWAGYPVGCVSFDNWTNFLASIKPVVVSQFRASTFKEGLHLQQTNSECPEDILWYHKKAEQRIFLSPWLWRQRASVRVLWAGLIVFLSWPGLFGFSHCVEEWVKLLFFFIFCWLTTEHLNFEG